GDSERVVIGCRKPRLVLGRVDADKKPAAAVAKLAYLGEQLERLVGSKIANAGGWIEGRDRACVEIRSKVERTRKIGDDAGELDLRMGRGKPRQGGLDRGCRDIDGDEAPRFQRSKPGLALGAIARAEIDKLPVAADHRGNRLAVRAEDRPLGAREVILGQLADRFEQRATQAVVEVLRRYRRRRGEQAVDQRGPFGPRLWAERADHAVHKMITALFRPLRTPVWNRCPLRHHSPSPIPK